MSATCEGILVTLDESARLVRRLVERDLARWGLSLPAWRVLTSLDEEGALSVGDLAAACSAQLPSMTRLINRMEASGLVERQRDTTDQRVRLVRLTAEGHQLTQRLSDRLPVCEELAAHLGTRDVLAIQQLLGRLLINLRELATGAPLTDEMAPLPALDGID